MSKARLLELLNREPEGSERQIVVIVNGESPILIDPGRSINLPIDLDGVFLWIGRKAKPGVLDLPEGLKEATFFYEGEQWTAEQIAAMGDRHAPTGDETTHDPQALTKAILSHIELLPDAPSMTEAEAAIMDAMNATQARLDQVEEELRAAGVDPASLDALPDAVATIGRAFINGDLDQDAPGNDASNGFDYNGTADNPYGPDEPRPATTRPDLTKEGLEAMTFKELREIGNGLKVKGTSKAELVRDILAAITPEA